MEEIQSIAIDMDQVIVDTLQKEIDTYNRLFNKNLVKDDLSGKTIHEFMSKEEWIELYNEINKKGFFRDLEFIDSDTRWVLEEMNKIYDIYICTAAMEVPESFEDKFLWLREHLPFLDKNTFIFCGFKYVVGTDVLIDDSPYQLRRVRGQSIIYTSPFNEKMNLPYKRVDNWKEIGDIFLVKEVDKKVLGHSAD